MQRPDPKKGVFPFVVCAILFVGIGYLTFRMSRMATEIQTQRREQIFLSNCDGRRTDLEDRIQLDTEFLAATAGMISANPSLKRDQFKAFSEVSLPTREHLTGIMYAQIVSTSRLGKWKRAVARENLTLLADPLTHDTGNALVHFVEPYQALQTSHGVNLHRHPERRRALLLARDYAQTVSTAPHDLSDLGIEGTGWLEFVPVYETGLRPESIRARQKNILGYGVLVYSVDHFIHHSSLGGNLPHGLSYSLTDVEDSKNHIEMASMGVSPGPGYRSFIEAHDIIIGNRFWRLQFEASEEFAHAANWTPLVILLLGIGAAGSISLLIYLLTVQNARATSMVQAQTHEIAKSKDTLQRTADELQRANERLRSADQAKSDFLYTVSHELRTPLTVIHEYMEMILLGHTGEISDDAREFLGISKNQLSRVNRMINELLDFARIESESLLMRPRFVDSADVLERVYEFFLPIAEAHMQGLEISVPEDVPYIWVDPDRLEQILGNLIANSLKYTKHDGAVRVFMSTDEEEVVFLVEDEGPGIPEQLQPRLFDRFFQVDGDQPSNRGVGLGLAIAHALTTMQGGEISVQSGLGQGSCFMVRFPVFDESEVITSEYRSVEEGMNREKAPVFVSEAILPAGADGDALESWIMTHLPQDGSCRCIRLIGDPPRIVVIVGEEAEVIPNLATSSRAVFPLIQWKEIQSERRTKSKKWVNRKSAA